MSAVNQLLAALRERGADRRNAPEGLRRAFTELSRQEHAPELFIDDTIAAAEAALARDQPRFEAEQREARRLDNARHVRQRLRADRLDTSWAKCCTRLYSRSAADHAYWVNCLTCKLTLTYHAHIPDLNSEPIPQS